MKKNHCKHCGDLLPPERANKHGDAKYYCRPCMIAGHDFPWWLPWAAAGAAGFIIYAFTLVVEVIQRTFY